jgi:hypothetical protein
LIQQLSIAVLVRSTARTRSNYSFFSLQIMTTFQQRPSDRLDQRFPNCAPRVPKNPRPIPSVSADTRSGNTRFCRFVVCFVQLTLWAGHDSSVGIASRYGLDGPGDRNPVEAIFPAPVHTGPVAHPASRTVGIGFFPGVKRPGRVVDHPPPSSAKVKDRIDQYMHSTSGPS